MRLLAIIVAITLAGCAATPPVRPAPAYYYPPPLPRTHYRHPRERPAPILGEERSAGSDGLDAVAAQLRELSGELRVLERQVRRGGD